MKNSALTVGSIAVLSMGISLAQDDSSGPPPCRKTCKGFARNVPLRIFFDEKENVHYVLGVCECDCKVPNAWEEKLVLPEDDEPVIKMKIPDGYIEHTNDGHDIPHPVVV
jgi:hypothetical protein